VAPKVERTKVRFTFDLQVNVDASAGNRAEVVYRWLDEMSQALVPEARAEIADLPARMVSASQPYGPQGEPGRVFGSLETYREPEQGSRYGTSVRHASAAGMRWLREELVDLPKRATLWFGRLDDEWRVRSGHLAVLEAAWIIPESPDWLRLSAYVPEMTFLDPVDGLMWQRRYLDAAFALADQWNPGFGHAAYVLDGYQTAYEAALRRIHQPVRQETWDERYTINVCRTFLRGYSWLTIVPADLVPRLGDSAVLVASGAFVDARPLSRGGLWLLATHDYRDFDDDALRRVHQVVKPVLRPGRLTSWPRHDRQPPLQVIFPDT
jgi:hypothetical protein